MPLTPSVISFGVYDTPTGTPKLLTALASGVSRLLQHVIDAIFDEKSPTSRCLVLRLAKFSYKNKPLKRFLFTFGGAYETHIEPLDFSNVCPVAEVMEGLKRFKRVLADIVSGRHEDMIKYRGGAYNYEL